MNDADASTAPDTAQSVVAGMFRRDAVYLALWSVQLVLVALLTPVTTRLLGQYQFGRVTAAATVFEIAQAVLTLGLQTGVQRIYSGQDGEAMARRLVTAALLVDLLETLVVYLTGRWWAPAIGFHSFGPTVRYAILWSSATAATAPALWMLRSRDRLDLFALVTLTQSLAAEALAVGLVIGVHRSSSEYMLGQVLAQVAAAAMALLAVRPLTFRREHVARLMSSIRFSAAIVPGLLAAFVVGSSDRLVVQADLGGVAVGRYSVGTNVGAFTLVILSLLEFIWLPRLLAIEDSSVRQEVLGLSRRVLCILVGSVAVALVLASPLLLLIWAPPSFNPRGLLWVTALGAASAMPVAQSQMFSQALLIKGRSGAVSAGVFLTAVVNLGLNVWLVPKLGITGSAAISAGCYVLQMGVMWLLARHEVGRIGVYVAGVGTLVAGFVVVSALIPPTGVALVLRLCGATLAGLFFLAQLVVLTRPAAVNRWPFMAKVLPFHAMG